MVLVIGPFLGRIASGDDLLILVKTNLPSLHKLICSELFIPILSFEICLHDCICMRIILFFI